MKKLSQYYGTRHTKKLPKSYRDVIDTQCNKKDCYSKILIHGVKKLNNSDIKIVVGRQDEADELRAIDWSETVYTGLHVHQWKHGIVIHDVPKADINLNDDNNSPDTVPQLPSQNPGLTLHAITPLLRKQNHMHEDKNTQSIIVFIDSISRVAKCMAEGLIINY